MEKKSYILLFFSFFLLISNAQEKSINHIFSKTLEVVNEKNKKESFKGQILKGKRNGMGVLLQRNGALYIGDFYRDMISGYGMFIASEDSYVDNCDSCTVYIGNWKNGVKSGFGICYANNGDIIYQGQFEKDKPISQYPSNNIDLQKYFSYFDFGNGEYFLGEMEKETANGYGIMVYDNGDLCIGNFKEGKRNGIGLYLLYNGEWETINFEGDNYNIVSSSINYRNIDTNRKANIKSSLSEAFGYFAQAANQTVQIASEVQSIKKGEKPFSNTSSNVNISENTNLSDDNISKEKKSSTVPYSISANQNKNTDSRTYANYDGMLSKMRYGNMEYDDAKRKEYQSKMRALREKWEKRGERFQHSENEDWLGK